MSNLFKRVLSEYGASTQRPASGIPGAPVGVEGFESNLLAVRKKLLHHIEQAEVISLDRDASKFLQDVVMDIYAPETFSEILSNVRFPYYNTWVESEKQSQL